MLVQGLRGERRAPGATARERGTRAALLRGMELFAPQIKSSFYNYTLRLHRHHEDLFVKLVDAMMCGAPIARQIWSEIDSWLRAHMDTEERHILPEFARVDLEESRALLADHAKIREQLLECGVAIDLHEIEVPLALVELVRQHAVREEKLMERWSAQLLVRNSVEQAGH